MTTARPVNIFTPHEGAHYLHRQTSAKVPRRFVFFDTEAYRDHHAGGEHQRWRLGVTATVTGTMPKDLDQSQAGSSHHS